MNFEESGQTPETQRKKRRAIQSDRVKAFFVRANLARYHLRNPDSHVVMEGRFNTL